MRLSEIKNTVDERIVRLNEIIETKLSSVSKNRREQLREDKCLAKYVVENYDSKEVLGKILRDKEVREFQNEIYRIILKRVMELANNRC